MSKTGEIKQIVEKYRYTVDLSIEEGHKLCDYIEQLEKEKEEHKQNILNAYRSGLKDEFEYKGAIDYYNKNFKN